MLNVIGRLQLDWRAPW